MGIDNKQVKNEWKDWEKPLFRFFFIYFLIQVFPLDWKFYRDLFSIDWSSYRDIFYLSRYQPSIFGEKASFADWGIIALLAGIGTIIWTWKDRNSKEYNYLYYGLRVLLRYRLAIGIIAYGFLKLFPLQAPYPSISNLNTAYGDFDDWKLFSLSLGIVPSYESFLGLVEISAGLLLLFRRTTTIGTLIILPFTGNVFISNLAYSGGEYVYSLYLISIALFLFAFDGLRFLILFTFDKPTQPNFFQPSFDEPKWKYARAVVKSAFFLLIFVYAVQTYQGYTQEGSYHFPTTKGLKEASGVYNVSLFKVKNDTLPYSKIDPLRWQDVVFEEWATLSVKSNRPVQLVSTNTEEIYQKEQERDYELIGSGGRHYYSYEIDSTKQVLTLKNKNKNYQGETLQLSYSRPNPSQIILQGINENKDSVYVVLDKINKKYLLEEVARLGRRNKLKL